MKFKKEYVLSPTEDKEWMNIDGKDEDNGFRMTSDSAQSLGKCAIESRQGEAGLGEQSGIQTSSSQERVLITSLLSKVNRIDCSCCTLMVNDTQPCDVTFILEILFISFVFSFERESKTENSLADQVHLKLFDSAYILLQLTVSFIYIYLLSMYGLLNAEDGTLLYLPIRHGAMFILAVSIVAYSSLFYASPMFPFPVGFHSKQNNLK